MGTRLQEADLDLGAVAKIIRALHNPVSSDPGSPVNGELWYNSTSDVFKYRAGGATKVIANLDDVSAGGISSSMFDAFSILAADTDNTPAALTVGASTVVGRRASGGVIAISYANLKTDLAVLTTAEVEDIAEAAVAAVIDAAPGTLDTLNELAAALGDDPNFAATTATALGLKTEIYSSNFGNASAQSFNFSHSFATTHVHVQVFRNSDGVQIDCGVTITDANTVNVTTVSVPGSNAYRVEIIGRNL